MGGVWTPISKPKRKPIGTSGKGLKGEILFNMFSQTSGMNGVLTTNKSSDGVAQLGGMRGRTAEGTEMFTASTGRAVFTAGKTIPRVTVPLARPALSCTGWFNSVKVAWDPIRITGGWTVPWDVAFCTVAAENASSGFGGVWLRLLVSKGRTLAKDARFLSIR